MASSSSLWPGFNPLAALKRAWIPLVTLLAAVDMAVKVGTSRVPPAALWLASKSCAVAVPVARAASTRFEAAGVSVSGLSV